MKKKTSSRTSPHRIVDAEVLRSVIAGDCTYDGKRYSRGSRIEFPDGSTGMCVWDPTGDKWITING